MADWIELNVEPRLVRNVSPVNLGSTGFQVLTDVDPNRENGTLSSRYGHKKHSNIPFSRGIAIGGRSMWDDYEWLFAIGRNSADDDDEARFYCYNGRSSNWSELSSGGINAVPPIGGGECDLDIQRNAARTFGENCGWYGRLAVERNDDGTLRRWNSSDGELITSEVAGCSNKIIAEDSWFNLRIRPINVGDGHYGAGTANQYYVTCVYDGDQESPMVTTLNWGFVIVEDGDSANVEITVEAFTEQIPKRVVAIRIYRTNFVSGDTTITRDACLLETIPIYKLGGQSANWAHSPGFASKVIYDTEFKGRTYYQVTGYSKINNEWGTTITHVSPRRRHGRIFPERSFFWGVTDDSGVEHYDRLYYSHYSGDGIHCHDIILPANYIELGFKILDVVRSRGYTIVVGDTGFAVGSVGGEIKEWVIHSPDINVGCIARNTICATPMGPMYLGANGVYLIDGAHAVGPLMTEIFDDIRDEELLQYAHAEYSQKTNRYYLFVNADNLTHVYTFDLSRHRVLYTTTPNLSTTVDAVGTLSSGGLIASCNTGVFKLEDGTDYEDETVTPSPDMQTGFIHFAKSHTTFQSILAVQLSYRSSQRIVATITGYPSGDVQTVTFPAATSRSLAQMLVDSVAEEDFAHSFRFSIIDGGKCADLFIERVFIKVMSHERTV